MLSALAEVILPVVLVAAVGVALGRAFTLDGNTVGKLNLYGTTPFLAYDSLMKSQVPAGEAFWLVAGYVLAVAALGVVAALASAGLPGDTRRGVMGAAMLGNNGNFGLPIALLALGKEGLDHGVVIFLTSVAIMYTVGPVLLGARGGGVRAAVMTILRLPVTWAMSLAVLFRLIGFNPPTGFTRGVELLAASAVPLVLLGLGIQLAESRRIPLTRPILTAVGLRVFVGPILALGVALLLPLSATSTRSLLLACSMPTAVNAFMLAREYGTDAETAAGAVALSTLLSIGTLALVITWLPHLR